MSKTKFKYSVRECLIHFFKCQKDFKNTGANYSYEEHLTMLQETVSKKWKPTKNEIYYCLNEEGKQIKTEWCDDDIDSWNYKTGNCFPYTKEGKKQAEEYREKLLV